MYDISSFYQSTIWQNINQYVYQKPVLFVQILGITYQCIIHDKKIFGIHICRCQILGINTKVVSEYILDIRSQIKSYLPKNTILIYVQFGFSDKLDDNLTKLTRLQRSLRENMPSGSTYINTTNHIENLYEFIGKSHKNHIKKAIARKLSFEIGTILDKDKFYEIWIKTSEDKGFGIPSKTKFDDLVKYIYDKNVGKIFLVKIDDNIVGGAVCLFLDKTCIYLYGMTDRTAGNIGTNQFLHWEIIKRCHNDSFHIYDFLGISGINDDEKHHLAGVTKFKLGFGGQADYTSGSYDFITNKYMYRMYQKISK